MIVKNEFFLVTTERSQNFINVYLTNRNAYLGPSLLNKCNKDCIEQNKESKPYKVKKAIEQLVKKTLNFQ